MMMCTCVRVSARMETRAQLCAASSPFPHFMWVLELNLGHQAVGKFILPAEPPCCPKQSTFSQQKLMKVQTGVT